LNQYEHLKISTCDWLDLDLNRYCPNLPKHYNEVKSYTSAALGSLTYISKVHGYILWALVAAHIIWLWLSKVHACWIRNWIHMPSQRCSLLIEPRVDINIWRRIQISFERISLWCLLFAPNRVWIIYLGVRFRKRAV
jgi:hypothetical protein